MVNCRTFDISTPVGYESLDELTTGDYAIAYRGNDSDLNFGDLVTIGLVLPTIRKFNSTKESLSMENIKINHNHK